LYALVLLPIFLAIFLFSMYQKKRNLKKIGEMRLLRDMMPDIALKRQYFKFWLLLGAMALFIVIIAGPQFGSKLETVKKQGIEVMICLDVSNSMLSNDITPSRLGKSKQMLERLINTLNNDKIGLIVFAGDAFIQLPITSDYVSAKMFLSSISPAMVPVQGTAIGAAVNLAVRSFSPDSKAEKAIILITDGENHEDDAIGAVKAAVDKGIKVSVLGVGSVQGGPIPIPGSNGFQKDAEGNTIITKLNEQMCQDIALNGKGMYARTDNSNSALRALEKELNKLNKSDVESKIFTSYDEKYQIFGWFLLVALIVEFFILDRRNRVLSKIKLF
jgi:Ca-activated chloride channel family protein